MRHDRPRTSQRTRIRITAYVAGYQESTGPIASRPLYRHARRFIQRAYGNAPAYWMFRLALQAYRRGWRDQARGALCQPWVTWGRED